VRSFAVLATALVALSFASTAAEASVRVFVDKTIRAGAPLKIGMSCGPPDGNGCVVWVDLRRGGKLVRSKTISAQNGLKDYRFVKVTKPGQTYTARLYGAGWSGDAFRITVE